MVGGLHGMLLLSAKHARSLVWWEDTMWKGGSECLLRDQWYRLEQWSNITLFLKKTNLDHQFGAKVLPGTKTSRLCIIRWRNLERRHYGRRHWRLGGHGRIWNPRSKAQCKGRVNAAKKWKLHFPSRRLNSQNLWERTASQNIHL